MSSASEGRSVGPLPASDIRELEVVQMLPSHGPSALDAEPVVASTLLRDGDGCSIADLALAALRVTSSLGLTGDLHLRSRSSALVVDLSAPWSVGSAVLRGVVDDARTVRVVVRGEASGELVWTLTRHADDSTAMAVSATAGQWYPQVVRELVDAAERVVARAAEWPDRPLGTFDGLPRASWAEASHGPQRPATSAACVLDAVLGMCASRPDQAAVVDERGSISYGELEAEIERVAAVLAESGAEPGDLVALHLARGRDLVAAMLGTWHARCAFVALDPQDPTTRHRHLLEAARPRFLLSSQRDLELVDDDAVRRIDVAETPSRGAPDGCCGAADVAYVMFTSGSTGAPKGATVAQEGMLNHSLAKIQDLGISGTDVVAQTGPISFDIIVWQCVAPLICGATVFVVPDAQVRDARATLAALDAAGVTVWQALPAVIRVALETSRAHRPPLEALRWVVPTGDALPTDLCRTWLEAYPRVPLLNTYGSTECSDDQCHHVVDRVDATDPPVMLIGRPIPGMSVYILDAEGLVAPPGVPGELYIAGIGVGPGYWRRADLTSERFVVVPGLEAAGTLYRSGDRGRRRLDGTVEFLGRIDGTVKIDGRRIETALVEAATRRHPGVRDCVVVARRSSPHDSTEVRLVAFVVVNDETIPDDLAAFVATELDEHHVPDQLIAVGSIPLSANGKVDRSALLVPAADPADAVSRRSLRTPTEELVADIWSKVLAVEVRDREDDFFGLGGRSLSVARVLSRLERATGVHLPLRSGYDNPTVRGLAAAVDSASRDTGPARWSIPVGPHATTDGPFDLTELQQAYRVGESDLFRASCTRAHLWAELAVTDLDVDRLRRAVDHVVRAHDVLRVVFNDDGQQEVLAEVPATPVDVVHVAGRSSADQERVLASTRRRFAEDGPDTRTWPLFDLAVVEHDQGQSLFLNVSLLVVDAATEALLIRELVGAYTGDGGEVVPRTAYADAVRAVYNWQGGAQPDADEQYWHQRLSDFPGAPSLPMRSSKHAERPVFTRRSWRLDEACWRDFCERAATHGVTPTSALLTVYAEVLRRWSRTPRFALSTLTSLRMTLGEQVDGLAGNLSSTIPTVVDCSHEVTFVERARTIQHELVEDLEHARTSGVASLRQMAVADGWSESVTLPVVFASTLDVGYPSPNDLPFPAQVVASGLRTPHVLLDHQVYEYDRGFEAVFDSVDDAFDEGVIDDLWSAYCSVVATLAGADAPWERSLGELPELLGPPLADAEALVVPDGAEVLHGGFVQQATSRPDAVALTDADGTRLTYGELHDCSRHVAARLRNAGVSPGDLVAHVMSRGWEQVAAIIGTGLAGAAYLPVDSNLPDERVRYLVDQASASVALTQEAHADRLEQLGITPLVVDAAPGPVTGESPVEVRPDDLAYVIFTSGSTGAPKGVMIDHRGAVNTIVTINETLGLTERDVVLGLSSTSFDLSVWDVFGTLSSGAHLVLIAAGDYRDPAHWHDQVVRHGVTVWNSVPALLDLYVGHREMVAGAEYSPLRAAMLSGDWIPVTLPVRARRALGEKLRVISLGGATEASIWSIAHEVGEHDPDWSSIPYGRALAGQGIHVVDEQLRPRVDLAVGELCISGVGLSLGYWRDLKRTAERFVSDPRSGARLYRTGDLGRRHRDGLVEFLGRADTQVKIQGFRVELGEIEARLTAHDDVSAAAVTVHGSAGDGRYLIAHVVTDPPVDPTELRGFAEASLPAYMIPKHFLPIEALPLSANGKVDRSRLQGPSAGASAVGADDGAPDTVPENELEGIILAEMRAVLGPDSRISVSESFFYAGGNSFSAMRLVTRLRARLGVELRLSKVFEAASARGIATVVSAEQAGIPSPDATLVPLRAGGFLDPLFLVHPVGGSVGAYQDLVAALDPDRPVFGLQATTSSVPTLVAMAQRYADVVEAKHPTGAVLVGGWSMGGIVALEVARLLTDRGRKVTAVLAIDADPRSGRGTLPEDLVSLFLTDAAGGGVLSPPGLDRLRRLLADAAPGLPTSATATAEDDDLASVGPEAIRERFDLFVSNLTLLAHHVPTPVDVQALVVQASRTSDQEGQGAQWSRLIQPVGGVRVLEGDHYSLVRNDAAQQIAAWFEEVAR